MRFCTQNGMFKTKKCPIFRTLFNDFQMLSVVRPQVLAWSDPRSILPAASGWGIKKSIIKEFFNLSALVPLWQDT